MNHSLHWRLILVPTDFSAASDEALKLAGRLARQNGSRLLVVHVTELLSGIEPTTLIHPAGVATPISVQDFAERDTASRIEAQVLKAVGADVPYEGRLCFGSPAKQIVEAAEHAGAHLIVMATHGRTGLSHLVMGSVAERVVRTSPIPVLSMRARVEVETPVRAEALVTGTAVG
jgi:nucleotide-binding universal stress UspA family protein